MRLELWSLAVRMGGMRATAPEVESDKLWTPAFKLGSLEDFPCQEHLLTTPNLSFLRPVDCAFMFGNTVKRQVSLWLHMGPNKT